MKRVHNFHRKRPHLLPPLPNSPSSLVPAQPDLLLSGKRLGSPAPKSSAPLEFEYVCNDGDNEAIICIDKPCEKSGLLKFDLLSDSIFGKSNNLLQNSENEHTLNVDEQMSGGGKRKEAQKQWEKFPDDGARKNMKSKSALPLVEYETSNNTDGKLLQIPNRYTLLKPIGEGK